MTAPVSSKRGTVSRFKGATLILEHPRADTISFSLLVTRVCIPQQIQRFEMHRRIHES